MRLPPLLPPHPSHAPPTPLRTARFDEPTHPFLNAGAPAAPMRALLLFLVLAVAGCADVQNEPLAPLSTEPLTARQADVTPEGLTDRPAEPDMPTDLPAEAPVVSVDRALRISGTCPAACTTDFRLEPPEGTFWLEARIGWDGTGTADVSVSLSADGDERRHRGFDSARHQVWDAAAGTYSVTVEGGAFEGWVRVLQPDGRRLPGDDLLPNLVTLVPTGIDVASCTADERVEQEARRCLRLGNAVANMGDGPLEVHLSHLDGALSPAGMGHFVQRVYDDAGGHRDVDVGAAQFHVVHGHFHYRGLAHFALHEWDEETGLRGEEVGRGTKQGFCFLDWGPMEDPEVDPENQQNAEVDCLVPDPAAGWSMGITVGWYDYYWAALSDQYVEVSGVPDGTYELVSVADGPGTLLETDEEDNAASVVLRLRGDEVTVLEERGFYANPEAEP